MPRRAPQAYIHLTHSGPLYFVLGLAIRFVDWHVKSYPGWSPELTQVRFWDESRLGTGYGGELVGSDGEVGCMARCTVAARQGQARREKLARLSATSSP
jgi:hypothetical protein